MHNEIMSNINKVSIEKVINNSFDTLEDKIDNIENKIDNIEIDVLNSNDINFPYIISNKMILDSFILPIEVLNKMKDSIELSLSMNKEIGFNLCLNQNELTNDSQQIGTKDEILTIRNCTKGKYVGKFHTHPPIGGGKSDLSFFDIANIYYDGFGCVGGTLDGLIYCYIRKGEVQTKIKEEITFYANKFEKKKLSDGSLKHKDKLESLKIIKKLQDEFFKTFLIEEIYEEEYEEIYEEEYKEIYEK